MKKKCPRCELEFDTDEKMTLHMADHSLDQFMGIVKTVSGPMAAMNLATAAIRANKTAEEALNVYKDILKGMMDSGLF